MILLQSLPLCPPFGDGIVHWSPAPTGPRHSQSATATV